MKLDEKALGTAVSHWRQNGNLADAIRAYITSATLPDVADSEEEKRIDSLRIKAFQTNAEQDRQAYFDAASKWFQDRHFRRMAAATALRLSAGGGASQAARDVLAERRRQIEAEGWTPEHDDEHTDFSLARAAAAYAYGSSVNQIHRSVIDAHGLSGVTHFLKSIWPETWAWKWFKPTNRRRDLVKAGALILAEVERIDRLPASPTVEAGR